MSKTILKVCRPKNNPGHCSLLVSSDGHTVYILQPSGRKPGQTRAEVHLNGSQSLVRRALKITSAGTREWVMIKSPHLPNTEKYADAHPEALPAISQAALRQQRYDEQKIKRTHWFTKSAQEALIAQVIYPDDHHYQPLIDASGEHVYLVMKLIPGFDLYLLNSSQTETKDFALRTAQQQWQQWPKDPLAATERFTHILDMSIDITERLLKWFEACPGDTCCDIKAENVIVDPATNRIRLIDYDPSAMERSTLPATTIKNICRLNEGKAGFTEFTAFMQENPAFLDFSRAHQLGILLAQLWYPLFFPHEHEIHGYYYVTYHAHKNPVDRIHLPVFMHAQLHKLIVVVKQLMSETEYLKINDALENLKIIKEKVTNLLKQASTADGGTSSPPISSTTDSAAEEKEETSSDTTYTPVISTSQWRQLLERARDAEKISPLIETIKIDNPELAERLTEGLHATLTDPHGAATDLRDFFKVLIRELRQKNKEAAIWTLEFESDAFKEGRALNRPVTTSPHSPPAAASAIPTHEQTDESKSITPHTAHAERKNRITGPSSRASESDQRSAGDATQSHSQQLTGPTTLASELPRHRGWARFFKCCRSKPRLASSRANEVRPKLF